MPQVAIERSGHVATVTITNPPRGYMDAATVAELDAATAALEADDTVRAVVITGGLPGVFIRHYSVVELEGLARSLRERGVTVDPARTLPERDIDRVFGRLESMPKPVIAAINGFAMGGGFELALACDLRVAEEGPYELGLPEVRLGILPGAGGTQKLPALVGVARALELILRGRTVSPAEAAALGLVHELAPAGRALERAHELAAEMAALPPRALAHCKRLIRGTHTMTRAEGLALERTLFLDLLLSDDALERMTRMNADDRDIRDA
ncbi:enoyl-CoA hydratase/isomerase family protein [Tepidiforma sp.]|uniref:enoyl-CoA hydratase/isomerase family protein n=1 Tax=Tepidiforma sp. TaxID=2682230 RepID=UPI002ADD5102|nr:enoyl-CoA hydratase/isomerase family protein [Tepidiforma sp.]